MRLNARSDASIQHPTVLRVNIRSQFGIHARVWGKIQNGIDGGKAPPLRKGKPGQGKSGFNRHLAAGPDGPAKSGVKEILLRQRILNLIVLSENIRGIEPDNVKNILWVAGFHKMILNIRLDYMLKSVPPQRMRKDLFKRRRAQVSGKIAQKSIHRAVVRSEACAVKRLTQSDCGSEMETPERAGSQRDARKKIHSLAERRRCEIRL